MKCVKMEAAGNDFIIFNGFKYNIADYSTLSRKVCHRQLGIGADGILVCEKSELADIKMIYYNSDGSQGEMCGNGIRCFSKYVFEEGLINEKNFTVETLAGIKNIDLQVEKNIVSTIKVNMGKPTIEGVNNSINIDGEKIILSSILVGVPHVVIFVKDIEDMDIIELGKKIENHSLFPKKTNVNFVEVINRRKINIFTWERGAGRTLGCGTGSCASVVIGNILGKLEDYIQVKTEGGELEVQLKEDYQIYMKGGANKICKGVYLDL